MSWFPDPPYDVESLLETARRYADMIDDLEERVSVLAHLAFIRGRTGDRAAVSDIADCINDLVLTSDRDISGTMAGTVAETWTRCQDIDQAVRWLARIADPEDRCMHALTLARTSRNDLSLNAYRHFMAMALRAVRRIHEPGAVAFALGHCAVEYCTRGDSRRGIALICRARAVAKRASDSTLVQYHLAWDLLEAGLIKDALEVAGDMADSAYQHAIWREAVEAYADKGEWRRARELIDTLPWTEEAEPAWRSYARGLLTALESLPRGAGQKLVREMVAAYRHVHGATESDNILAIIVSALALQGKLGMACQLSRHVACRDARDEVCDALAAAYVRQGQIAHADEYISQISDASRRIYTRMHALTNTVKYGMSEQVRSVCNSAFADLDMVANLTRRREAEEQVMSTLVEAGCRNELRQCVEKAVTKLLNP